MDMANRFDSKVTYRLIRAEYLVALVVCVELFIGHIDEVRWLPAILLFVYIDLIGYLPGAIAYHRSTTKRISRGYYVAYNVMHSFVTQAAVAGLWAWLVKPEWALLAIPIHLCGDRALFGNFLKPFAVSFEPSAHPAFKRMLGELNGAPVAATPATPGAPAGSAVPAAPAASGSARPVVNA